MSSHSLNHLKVLNRNPHNQHPAANQSPFGSKMCDLCRSKLVLKCCHLTERLFSSVSLFFCRPEHTEHSNNQWFWVTHCNVGRHRQKKPPTWHKLIYVLWRGVQIEPWNWKHAGEKDRLWIAQHTIHTVIKTSVKRIMCIKLVKKFKTLRDCTGNNTTLSPCWAIWQHYNRLYNLRYIFSVFSF